MPVAQDCAIVSTSFPHEIMQTDGYWPLFLPKLEKLLDGEGPCIRHPGFQIGFCRAGASVEVLGVEGQVAGHLPQRGPVSALCSVLWAHAVAAREVPLRAGLLEGTGKHGERVNQHT